jgi:hypothetical protein
MSDRFAFLKSDNLDKSDVKKNEKTNKLQQQQEKPDKTKNRFLNPTKKENSDEDNSNRFKNLISDIQQNHTQNKNQENTRFTKREEREQSQSQKKIILDNSNHDHSHNMFESSLNKNKFSIYNEEMFPDLSDDIQYITPNKQEVENIVNYQMLSNKIILEAAFEENLKLQESQSEPIREDIKFIPPPRKTYCDRNFHRDIIEKYTLEKELKKMREIEKSFNEWNERRIERLKESYDYNYIWDEDKRNAMLYCIYTDGLDDYGDDDYSDDNEMVDDYYYNDDLMPKNKKNYNDLINDQ